MPAKTTTERVKRWRKNNPQRSRDLTDIHNTLRKFRNPRKTEKERERRRAARVASALAELEVIKAQQHQARLALLAKEKHQGYSGKLNLSRR